MKKIVFFSLEDGWLGGVASVNLALQPALKKRGFEIRNLFLRGCSFSLEENPESTTIRKKCPWNFITGSEIKSTLKKNPIKACLLILCRLRDEVRNHCDFKTAKQYLLRENPDAIVVSSYLLLDAIPQELHSRTLHHVHTSFDATRAQKANYETLLRYNGKIGFLWLSENICNKAKSLGFQNSFYLYNPLSQFPDERSKTEEKKTISVITRFSPEKRLPLAVDLLKKALDRLPDPSAYSVEFWGTGPEEDAIRQAIGDDPRFSLMGQTKTPFEVLKHTRLNINTSSFEGFSISILEAAAAGVPTVSFEFGEAAQEEILNGKTGFCVPMDDREAFVSSLLLLLKDDALCRAFSLSARDWAKGFQKDVIAEKWEGLLSRLPLDKTDKT